MFERHSNVGESSNEGYGFYVYSEPDKSNAPATLKGKLLLANPCLRDSTFHKSVVLINQHSHDQGAMGLILNQPTGRVVGDLLSDPMFAPLSKLAVHDGGPVEHDQLTFSSFWWSQKLGLRWAVRISAEDAAKHARRQGRIVRAFIGYSSWTKGQLENELRSPSWFPVDPESDLLGSVHDKQLWANLMGRISPLHRILSHAPMDPQLN